MVNAATKHSATFSITCVQNSSVRTAIEAPATNPKTVCTPAKDADGELTGSEVAETTFRFAKRDLRLNRAPPAKVSWRVAQLRRPRGLALLRLITNIPPMFATAIDIEHHHRLRVVRHKKRSAS